MKNSIKKWIPVVLLLFTLGLWLGLNNRTPYPERFVGRWVYTSGNPQQSGFEKIIYQFYYKGVGSANLVYFETGNTPTGGSRGWHRRGGSLRWYFVDNKLHVSLANDPEETYRVEFGDNDAVMVLWQDTIPPGSIEELRSGRFLIPEKKVFTRAYVDWENAGEGMLD